MRFQRKRTHTIVLTFFQTSEPEDFYELYNLTWPSSSHHLVKSTLTVAGNQVYVVSNPALDQHFLIFAKIEGTLKREKTSFEQSILPPFFEMFLIWKKVLQAYRVFYWDFRHYAIFFERQLFRDKNQKLGFFDVSIF